MHLAYFVAMIALFKAILQYRQLNSHMHKLNIPNFSKWIRASLFAVALVSVTQYSGDIDRAKQLINNGDSDAALLELESEIARNPNPEAEFLRAVTLQGIGKRTQAMEAYAQMVQSYPELPEPYNNLAVMHAEDKNFDKAEQMLKRAISTNKTYATAYENLGDIHSQQASDAYNQALALSPANSKTVEVKLNLIDNILLPPNLRKPVMQASTSQPRQSASSSQTGAKPISRPVVSQTTDSQATQNNSVSSSDLSAVDTLVRQWARAWSDKDVATYLSYYSDNFKPLNGASKAAWAKYRAEKLQAPSFINVAVTDLNITRTSRGLRASFAQNYQSDTYEDNVLKSLELVNTAQGWKIQSEQSQAL